MHLRLVVLALGLSACGGFDSSNAREPSTAAVGVERRDVTFKHEPCDLASKRAVSLDANGDGRPEVVTVLEGDRPICRAADINLDGTIDVFSYFDASGQPRRRESGFDRDDLPDEIAYFERGQLVRKERETNNDGKIDTWDYYENGRLVREERDSSGDGFITQWWTFPDAAHPECAIVMTDQNSDTKPDPESKIDLCNADDDRSRKPAAKPAAKPATSATPAAPAASAAPAAPAAPAASAAPAAPAAPAASAVPTPKGTP